MPERARIIDIERSLGFKWPGGLSKQNRWLLPSNLRNLLEDIDHLKVQSVGHSNKRFYASKAFVERSEHLFSVHGPKIWPIDVNERSQWLSWAPSDNNDGLYPENLYHYNETHREKYGELFETRTIAQLTSHTGFNSYFTTYALRNVFHTVTIKDKERNENKVLDWTQIVRQSFNSMRVLGMVVITPKTNRRQLRKD